MAIDSAQKRMSAISPSCPWRGPLVDATESSFSVGNRMAAVFLYSGIAAAEPAAVPTDGNFEFAADYRRRVDDEFSETARFRYEEAL